MNPSSDVELAGADVARLDDHVVSLAAVMARSGGFEYTELGRGSQEHWCRLARSACRYFARKGFVAGKAGGK